MARDPWRIRTQSAEYWQDAFAVADEDFEDLYMFILEKGLPQDIETLALQVMKRHSREETQALRRETELHPVFQPEQAYQMGQALTFPSEGNSIGTIGSIRPGNNPAYGQFIVMEVEFEGDSRTKYFAAGLGDRAPVGLPKPPDLDNLIPPEVLFELYGSKWVLPKVREALQKNEDFVQFQDKWFLKELLVEIHVGHINICEAVVDIAGRPLSAEVMAKELELPDTITKEVQLFSLNYALSQAEMFINLSEAGEPKWHLVRLGPPEPQS